ncbi:MAG: hypothetical protein DBX39_01780 [Bacillota bacterium]|nr:MAG: hypothetical protein DBX39_01780 [Bacillota bacterium]
MAKYAVSERKENGRGRISSSAPDKILSLSYKLLQKLYPFLKFLTSLVDPFNKKNRRAVRGG